MTGWFEQLRRALGREDLVDIDARVPFGVVASEEVAWGEPTLTQRGERAWELTAASPRGLEATWALREHADTRAIECSGSIRNRGRAAIAGVRELRTLDLRAGLSDSWGEPWVRTFGGAQGIPAHFPPDEFRSRDRRLLRLPQVFTPVSAAAADNGYGSGQDLPCVILAGESGDRGLALFYEWSGLWSIGVKQDPAPPSARSSPWGVRLTAGVWGLALDLRPGEELPLPNLLVVGFDGGLDAGGNAVRRHVGRHVAPSLAGGEPVLPPVSFNHYFALENDFTAELLKPAAERCAQAGVEYFCVDAGWFPGAFRQGIGNWADVDPAKFPEGMPAFSRWLSERDLQLGLWLELEYAHLDSEILRAHPDWFLPGPQVSPWSRPGEVFYDFEAPLGVELYDDVVGPRFALLDLGQAEARQWCIDRAVEAYERWGVRWFRWDFNQTPRPHWDATAGPGRVGINQVNCVTGFHEVCDEIMRACPDLFMEQCASGGFRIDLGTVRRGHAFWMSDHTTDTDVVRALQHGLNSILPGIYANTNLCQARFDYDDYDYLSHGGGSLGISGRLWEASPADFGRYREAVARFKSYRHLLGGEYSRPTGDPGDRFDRAAVSWSEAGETVAMEFNAAGPRTVDFTHG